MPKDDLTEISKDGLRYISKEGGSPYGPGHAIGTMSCYKCGVHKPRALGTFRRLLGKSMFVCADCKTVSASIS